MAKVSTAENTRFIKFCTCSIGESLAELDALPTGLSEKDAEKRLAEFGKNEINTAKKKNFFADMFERFSSPLVVQLLMIALVSAIIGESLSSIIVGCMILLSVGLSYILDQRSNLEVEALGKRVQSRTYVLRDGVETEIKMSEVVPGDIVLLQAGAIVPADVRIISCKDFFVSESALTGESMPVEKTAQVSGDKNLSALELPNACFMGSSVTSGTAKALVIHTGTKTIFGSLSQKLSEKREETSFDRGIRSFTWLMIRFMLILVSVVFCIVGITKGNWLEALLFSLSVAVGLTPEMLPMMVTVNLAKGALAMAKKKVIVKKLPAIQNLGSINILCTDKTGTLTQDRVFLEHHVDIIGNQSEEVLNYAYLNSYFQTGLKNLLDRAVIEHVDLNVDECRLVDELPFDFQRRRMSVIVEYEGDNVLICKGAVEEIYSSCTHYQIDEEIYPLIDMIRADLFEEVEKLNREGFRVLGLAYREFPTDKKVFTIEDESKLILLGYIAFMDPPKESATEAIHLLNKAGVHVKVLTGDNGLVTRKVCSEVGIEFDQVISGTELSRMDEAQFTQTVAEQTVFVKLTPAQKEQIVKELRRQGNVVGFMGDGINDATALKAADVGISVDSAVDVAKESADIVLLEKSLLVLEEGIIEGRKIFANIIKYIRMGASSNFGNMFSVLGASYLLPFLPMQPIQILTNNLLYDFSQTGIPLDRVDPEQVAKPVHWNIENIKRFMIFIGPISSIFDYATFALMWFFFKTRDFLNPGLSSGQQDQLARLFQTGWFVESLLTQTLIVHIIRTRKIPFIQSRASPPMIFTTLLVMVIGVWLPYSPLAPLLGFVPLPATYFIWIAGYLVTYSVITHKVKTWFIRRFEGV
ncbi:magnesium-translocating P-type ATPase [Gracilinema caldarium]|uniref:Magnesium-transporting ATPase, P-type 1 n=1 Tax=Gracilinema caldarium (strain ATCC 51460 / DSM 7334 / H1) TaxID=744872 RepID=F8F220_GRAC1|nr:magnesium-translocating P-type ATPase [Gracilinema caldarium]AEJ20292.1 magnesium-translocating P-type ATPase [Gracilinema caldarium DSM 7334]